MLGAVAGEQKGIGIAKLRIKTWIFVPWMRNSWIEEGGGLPEEI